MENKLYQGSICVTDLLESLKNRHSSFSKSATNGKVYCNFLLWENSDLDKYGNSHSIQLNSKKELKEKEGKVYVGNCKPVQKKESSQTVTDKDIAAINISVDDVPF